MRQHSLYNAASRARGSDTVLLKAALDFFSVITDYVSTGCENGSWGGTQMQTDEAAGRFQ